MGLLVDDSDIYIYTYIYYILYIIYIYIYIFFFFFSGEGGRQEGEGWFVIENPRRGGGGFLGLGGGAERAGSGVCWEFWGVGGPKFFFFRGRVARQGILGDAQT